MVMTEGTASRLEALLRRAEAECVDIGSPPAVFADVRGFVALVRQRFDVWRSAGDVPLHEVLELAATLAALERRFSLTSGYPA